MGHGIVCDCPNCNPCPTPLDREPLMIIPPSTKLTVQSNASTIQLTAAAGLAGDTIYLKSEDNRWSLKIPREALNTIQPNDPIVVGLTLTRIVVEPVEPSTGLLIPQKPTLVV